MMLSVVIPAHNEEAHLPETVEQVVAALTAAAIPHEVVVVDDHSSDQTAVRMHALQLHHPTVRLVSNDGPRGFGWAVRKGLAVYTGEAVALVMADGSDDPGDLVAYYQKLQEGFECVFGSRFIRGGALVAYPWTKWCLNRAGNGFIRLLLGIQHNDLTNAFKCYRRAVIEGIQPLFSHHFNLTVELPLKAIVRGYTYATVPIRWYQRKHGIAKFQVQEMGSRYLFIILYAFLEKHLSRGDYRRQDIRHTPTLPADAPVTAEVP